MSYGERYQKSELKINILLFLKLPANFHVTQIQRRVLFGNRFVLLLVPRGPRGRIHKGPQFGFNSSHTTRKLKCVAEVRR